MDIDQLNIRNLNALWKKYGAQTVAQQGNTRLMANKSWPLRCWVEGEPDLAFQIAKTPDSHKLSSWPYPLSQPGQLNQTQGLNKHWQLAIDQTAMYIGLADYAATDTTNVDRFSLEKVKDNQGLKQWLAISSEAFGYDIDEQVFIPLLNDPDIEILMGRTQGLPAVSALLFRTENVIGLHQMGVKSAFQGQGLSTLAMHQLLSMAKQQGAEYMVLQASAAGLPVYQKLGFHRQFALKYFTVS